VGECVAAERDQQPRLHQRQLRLEPRHRVRHLVGVRIAVVRRPGLQHVGDEYLRPAEAGSLEQLIEQPAGAPDERASLLVLAGAGRLAHDHHVGRGGALAGHEVRARLARLEAAREVGADVLGDALERRHQSTSRRSAAQRLS
jgi:hypothetical protein